MSKGVNPGFEQPARTEDQPTKYKPDFSEEIQELYSSPLFTGGTQQAETCTMLNGSTVGPDCIIFSPPLFPIDSEKYSAKHAFTADPSYTPFVPQ